MLRFLTSLQLLFSVNELLAFSVSLIWKGRRSSINYEHGIFGLAFAGLRTAPER